LPSFPFATIQTLATFQQQFSATSGCAFLLGVDPSAK
jgi:nicotinic acid mononucleotide adenylyltransferase